MLLFTVIVRMLDVQIESATALILCAISCIILIIPINPTSTKMLIVVIFTPVAGNVLQLTLKQFFFIVAFEYMQVNFTAFEAFAMQLLCCR